MKSYILKIVTVKNLDSVLSVAHIVQSDT